MSSDALQALAQGASLGEVAARLSVALVVGGAVGWERERQDKPAGLRTHMLVALGSATFVLLGFEVGSHLAHQYGDPGFDPTRVLQGVVGGIGFLGAGTILKSSAHVSGITTAASVWITGALGAAAGLGAYLVAFVATVFALLTLAVLGRWERFGLSRSSD
ncbi:MAG TPA: MgtC/SapB family protein [Polyangiaceae bacterium]|nr:MgtC/SapB family protein [Polyangiaceae bacterium]